MKQPRPTVLNLPPQDPPPAVALLAAAARADLSLSMRLVDRMPDAAHRGLSLPFTGDVSTPEGCRWRTTSTATPIPAQTGAIDLRIEVALLEGSVHGAALDLACTVRGWDTSGYVFAPAMIYDGNRFEIVDVPYSPFWPDATHHRIEKSISTTNQPHLQRDGGPAVIELDTGGLATACLGGRAADGRGFLLFVEDANELGPLGLTVAENGPDGRIVFAVTTPRSRSRTPGMMGFRDGDAPRTWRAGDRATLGVRLHFFAAPRLQVLFDRFAAARKDVGTRTRSETLPWSAAASLVRAKVNTLNWDEDTGYYRHGISRLNTKPYDWWQLGWVTGGITTLPMLVQGDATARARARRNLDFMFTGSPVANGLWRAHHDGTKFNHDDPRPPRPGYLVSVRRLSDGLYHGLKQILLLTERGEDIPPAWDASARSLADVLVRIFERRGQIGQYLDIRTADIGIGGSTAGGILPAALVLAARRFCDPRHLRAALALGRRLVADGVEKGVTNGGPCDALAAPDSESCYALLVSLVELHQATGDAVWAAAAHNLVRQFSSWVTSRDVTWPAGSLLGAVGAPSSGTVWANIQNKHAAPGICTFSGEHLFRHWRATGDELALDLLRDITHALPHYVSRVDQPIGTLSPGMMCERVNLSDWEGRETVGGNIFGSTIWVETAMMLTAAELPGVYVRTDTGRVIVLDHVRAGLEARPRGWDLRLHNPTPFDAAVSVLAEDAVAAARPLGVNLPSQGRSVAVPAGGEIAVALPPASA